MYACYSGANYRAHREKIASAERFILPSLALLYWAASVSGPGHFAHIFPYSWGWPGLLYLALMRCVRWRIHVMLLIPEACMTATAALAVSACLDGSATPESVALATLQVTSS